MAFFPRVFASEFAPVFRILDDIVTGPALASRSVCSPYYVAQPQRSFRQAFQPRFDVRESGEAYELKGELPGVEQKDVQIEFTDANTLSIRGRTETTREQGTRTEVEAAKPVEAIDAAAETESKASSTNYHKPTIEDEEGVLVGKDGETETPASMVVSTPTTEASQAFAPAASKEAKPTYWVSERSVGSFARTFQFQHRVEHDAVKASLEDGILSIVVPKAQNVKRQISIE